MNLLRRLLPSRNDPAPAHIQVGIWGEQQAEQFLKNKGYRILDRRARSGRRGEIDLIAQHDNGLIFIEVKTRSAHGLYRPAAAVHARKRKALTRAVAAYLKRMKRKPDWVRLDVVEVIGTVGETPEIRHIEQAFKMSAMRRMQW